MLEITNLKTTVKDSFKIADTVLLQATKGISDLINVPGLINLDFADVSRVMQDGGEAIMGTGMATGEERAILAAQEAINSPLLQNKSIKGARGVLINITSSEDLEIHELNQASDLIYKAAGYDSSNDYDQEHGEIIHGFTVDNTLNDEVRVTVIATGLDQEDEVEINENKVQTNGNRYQIPDHDYNNPQTSINILNSNNDEDEVNNANIKEDTLINADDEVPVFGEDLEVPTYIRNRTTK